MDTAGFEPARIASVGLESTALTTRPSILADTGDKVIIYNQYYRYQQIPFKIAFIRAF
jgi:hypothetical protein